MTDACRTVLIVDDEEPLLLSLADGLASHSARFKTVIAPSGEAALEVVSRVGVDLVITDLRMPGIDGVELMRQLVSVRPGLPVVVLTAHSSVRALREIGALPLVAVLEKPVELDELLRVIYRSLFLGDEPAPRTNEDWRMVPCSDPEV